MVQNYTFGRVRRVLLPTPDPRTVVFYVVSRQHQRVDRKGSLSMATKEFIRVSTGAVAAPIVFATLGLSAAAWVQAVAAGTITIVDGSGVSVILTDLEPGEVIQNKIVTITSSTGKIRYGNGAPPLPSVKLNGDAAGADASADAAATSATAAASSATAAASSATTAGTGATNAATSATAAATSATAAATSATNATTQATNAGTSATAAAASATAAATSATNAATSATAAAASATAAQAASGFLATGNATLSGGTIAVARATISAGARILHSRKTQGASAGHIGYTLNAGVGFSLTSSDGADTGVITWVVVSD